MPERVWPSEGPRAPRAIRGYKVQRFRAICNTVLFSFYCEKLWKNSNDPVFEVFHDEQTTFFGSSKAAMDCLRVAFVDKIGFTVFVRRKISDKLAEF